MRIIISIFMLVVSSASYAGVLAIPQAQQQQTAVSVVDGIKKINSLEFSRRTNFVRQTYDLVWKNKQFTPEQIIEAMGTDAVPLFTYHGNEQIALATLAQQNGMTYTPLTVPANYTLTPQQDGSIVVVKAPEEQPEHPEGGGEN